MAETGLPAFGKGKAMKLSLSVRVAEPPKRKDILALPFDRLAAEAQAAGFAGLSMRASVVSVDAPAARVAAARKVLDDLGLAASMVCGDLALAANDAGATRAIRNITPYLDLAEALGSRLVRVMMHSAADIPFARRAADEAAERGLVLVHINHWGTLFETVDESLETLAAIGRPNFRAGFEPGNLLACRAAHGPDALARLIPLLANVYFQNVRLDPASPIVFQSRRHGPAHLRYVPVDDPSGIDIRPLIDTLRAAGYEGWFTVHQPLSEGEDAVAAMRRAAAFFLPRMDA
jgi:sugar phosphate isomerase/epimerase